MADFYSANPEGVLLLGDVLVGFRLVAPALHEPGELDREINITVTCPSYFVVMTPCCSIGNKRIALAPLIPIRGSFLDNPYFAEDLTRINRKCPEDKLLPPAEWQKLPAEVRAEKEGAEAVYGLVDCFIYDQHDLLKRYQAPRKGTPVETGYYLLEFGNIFKVDCKQVLRGKPAPAGVKTLELSVATRNLLRLKIVNYFGRVPSEDVLVPGVIV